MGTYCNRVATLITKEVACADRKDTPILYILPGRTSGYSEIWRVRECTPNKSNRRITPGDIYSSKVKREAIPVTDLGGL
jgi:hypothetical protein